MGWGRMGWMKEACSGRRNASSGVVRCGVHWCSMVWYGNNAGGGLGWMRAAWGSGAVCMVASGRSAWAAVFINWPPSCSRGNRKCASLTSPGRPWCPALSLRLRCAIQPSQPVHGQTAAASVSAHHPRPLAMIVLVASRHPPADCSYVSPA